MQRSSRIVAWIVGVAALLGILWAAWRVFRLAAVVMFWSGAVILLAAGVVYVLVQRQRSR